MIYINAKIGMGKTNLTTLLSNDLGTQAFYEQVDDMPMLHKFYEAGEDSRLALAFPLQVAFLNYRYAQLRKGLELAENQGMRNTVYDSSLLSDGLMAGNLFRRGEFPEEEYRLYQELSQNMQANVSGHPFNGFPDLVIYLGGSFDTMLKHIALRDRGMESLDDDKVAYFKDVHNTYENWANSYASSPMLAIDMDKVDYVNNDEDMVNVLNQIEDFMVSLSLLSPEEAQAIRDNRDIAKLKESLDD